MQKYRPRPIWNSDTSRFRQAEKASESSAEFGAVHLLGFLSQRCTWDDCRSARFYNLPVCVAHALAISGRVQAALNVWLINDDLPSHLPPSPEPFVYYLMIGPKTVKIGSTIDVRARIQQLRTDLQYVVALEWGGTQLERQRHRQFAVERLGLRENFELSERLRLHISTLQPYRDKTMKLISKPGGYRIETVADELRLVGVVPPLTPEDA